MSESSRAGDLRAVDNPEVDIAGLQAEVARLAAARRASSPATTARAPQPEPRRLHPLHRTADISPYPALPSRTPLLGPVVVAAQRAVRRALRWYLWPVTGRISAHNRAVADVAEAHRRELLAARMSLARMHRDFSALEEDAM